MIDVHNARSDAEIPTPDSTLLQNPLPGYFGSKDAAGSTERLLRLFPPHSVYVDAFLGGGAVLRRKTPALRTIAIDEDTNVIDAWRRANWPGLELHCDNAIRWLNEACYWLPADALVYLDPPYPLATRSSRRRYRFELSDRDHETLLDLACQLPCHVVISSYDNPLYRERLASWPVHDEWPAMTRGGVRIEHAWSNAADSVRVGAETRYAGLNFRDRLRIKRKTQRWTAKFDAMPERDRVAILTSLIARYDAARETEASSVRSGDVAGHRGQRQK